MRNNQYLEGGQVVRNNFNEWVPPGRLYAAPGHTIKFRELPYGTLFHVGVEVEVDGRRGVVIGRPCPRCQGRSVSFQTETGYYCSQCGER